MRVSAWPDLLALGQPLAGETTGNAVAGILLAKRIHSRVPPGPPVSVRQTAPSGTRAPLGRHGGGNHCLAVGESPGISDSEPFVAILRSELSTTAAIPYVVEAEPDAASGRLEVWGGTVPSDLLSWDAPDPEPAPL